MPYFNDTGAVYHQSQQMGVSNEAQRMQVF